jgi:hypothetical protein
MRFGIQRYCLYCNYSNYSCKVDVGNERIICTMGAVVLGQYRYQKEKMWPH